MSLSTSQYRLPSRNGNTAGGNSSTGCCGRIGTDLVGLAALLDKGRVPQPQLAGRGDEPAAAVAEGVGELLDGDVRLDLDPVGLAERGGLRRVGVEHQHIGVRAGTWKTNS